MIAMTIFVGGEAGELDVPLLAMAVKNNRTENRFSGLLARLLMPA